MKFPHKHIRFLFFLILFLVFGPSLSADFIDLEKEMLQDFVLECKRIKIPGFPYAFNPSIVRWKGSLLLSFRAGKDANSHPENCAHSFDTSDDTPSDETDPSDPPPSEENFFQNYEGTYYNSAIMRNRPAQCDSPNRIGLVWLDENFRPTGVPQLLEIPNHNPTYRQQDPRLVVVGNRLYIVYSDVIKGVKIDETRRMFIGELQFVGRRFVVKNLECIAYFEEENEKRWQKNWAPFDYKGEMLLSYSIIPHRVMRPFHGTGVCETCAFTQGFIQWEWGELRGGTPALLNGDEYLAFFHSSKQMATAQSHGKKMPHYFMGAYTFAAHPPFAVKKISPSPIVGKNFYNGVQYKTWKPLRVVFPMGYVMDKNYVWIAYGRQDHEVWITKLDKKKLLASLTPVPTIQ